MTKQYVGFEAASFYRDNNAYAGFFAKFQGEQGEPVYVAPEALAQALATGKYRRRLQEADISLREVETALRDVSYQRVRRKIEGRTLNRPDPVDFLYPYYQQEVLEEQDKSLADLFRRTIGRGQPFIANHIIGETSDKWVLRDYGKNRMRSHAIRAHGLVVYSEF
ncbi:MAG: hypothetical protein H6865_08230 [Rhodospirillales bacterium]|nr:hypothetical protein [Rhodospirillales bacterium]USO07682.1 MAG: hypothetical protein H6866_00120 [Rhodospirillales bacterium]